MGVKMARNLDKIQAEKLGTIIWYYVTTKPESKFSEEQLLIILKFCNGAFKAIKKAKYRSFSEYLDRTYDKIIKGE